MEWTEISVSDRTTLIDRKTNYEETFFGLNPYLTHGIQFKAGVLDKMCKPSGSNNSKTTYLELGNKFPTETSNNIIYSKKEVILNINKLIFRTYISLFIGKSSLLQDLYLLQTWKFLKNY